MASTSTGYTFGHEANVGPIAIITPISQESVVGALVKMDGRASYDTDESPSSPLTYTWQFARKPIGSQLTNDDLIYLEVDNSVVSFAPDVNGFYELQLVVNDGSLDSAPTLGGADISKVLASNNRGIIPDAKWIWNFLPDFWSLVSDRGRFDVMWSSYIQIAASEYLKLYQYDYNKSIKDIQEVFQVRWNHYDPYLELTESQTTGILADDQAGWGAATLAIAPETGIALPNQEDFFNLVTVPLDEGGFLLTSYNSAVATGRVLTVAGQSYTLARATNGYRATNEGIDGTTYAGDYQFYGSGFVIEDIGRNLLIHTGPDKGTYRITDVTNEGTLLDLTTLEGGTVSFASTVGDLSYSIIPASQNISSFFADQKVVPTQLAGQSWRSGSTLISGELDFEDQGVSPGDLLEVEIYRADRRLATSLQVQVVGVDRNRLSFVFNRDDLAEGVPAGGLSAIDQVRLADALQVSGLSVDVNGVLQYSLEAELVRDTITSAAFKRQVFERTIRSTTLISVGAFSVYLRPKKIIRNRRIPVDPLVESVPMLQEYIRQPDMGEENGQLYVIDRNGDSHEIDHQPYVLSENLDYVIDDESTITGLANTTQNVDEIEIPQGDLIDRSVQPGDQLELTLGAATQIYHVRKVLSESLLRCFPTPTETATGVSFTLTRRVAGKYIRFIGGTFDKDTPAPERLWAEVTFLNNNPNIEANFGSLVGVKEEDLTARSVSVPYRSAVAGLMYALTKGPVIENVRLSAQVLLGLPFAENAGVITEINPAFRTRTDGSPLYGRILIEGRDSRGNSTGVTNVYLYPQGRQLEDEDNPGEWIAATPDDAGIAVNPDTGVEYVVGDSVSQFAVLSKGVSVKDYLSDPSYIQNLQDQGSGTALITQYHSLHLSINSDVVPPADVDFAAEFVRKTKPTYIDVLPGLQTFTEDEVDIEDNILFGRELSFFETSTYSLPTAASLDYGDGNEFISVEGVMYMAYVYGDDLQTTQGSLQVESPTGGFLFPVAGQSFDPPYLRAGDLMVIEEGPNAGEYTIASIDSTIQATLVYFGTFTTATDQRFKVYRPVENPIFTSAMDVFNGNSVVTVSNFGMFSAGVAVGDSLTFYGGPLGSSYIYTIIRVDPSVPEIEVTPPIREATWNYTGVIWREGLVNRLFIDNPTHQVNFTATSRAVVFLPGSSDLDQLSFIRPGDKMYRSSTGQSFTILDYDPTTLTAYVTPEVSFTAATEDVEIVREKRPLTTISMELLDRIPDEAVTLELRPPEYVQDLLTTAASADVTTVSGENFQLLGVIPGDYLVVREGADSSVDIGYGDGIFPIQELPSSTTIRLTRPLSVTNTSPGVKYGIQRRKAL